MSPRFLQIHTLHAWPAALLNRDDAGLAKRMPFGGTERIRVSSQCLKRHWRTADDAYALAAIDPAIGTSVRSRRVWHVEIEEPLIAEGFEPDLVTLVLRALQDGLYGESEAAKKNRGDRITLERGEIVVLGRREIEHLRDVAREILRESAGDPDAAKKIAASSVKERRRNFHALIAGAGIDAAMFGRFVSGDREARVDAAVHVGHALTVHEQASEPDYFTAVDDLQAEEQGSGAGHLNTTELTSGVFYGYVVVDLPLLVANLEGCDPKAWAGAERTLAAKTVEHLLHLIAKVTPGAKLGSTAPYAWASLVLAEAGDEQPRSLANAFLEPVRKAPLDEVAARTLARHVASLDAMYGPGTRRWLATRHEQAAVPEAEHVTFPELVRAAGAAVRGEA